MIVERQRQWERERERESEYKAEGLKQKHAKIS